MIIVQDEPVLRNATPDDIPQIAPLFLASLDTSLPGVAFSTFPEYALPKILEHLRRRLFPAPAVRTFCLEVPTSGDLVGYVVVKEKGGFEGADEGPELDMLFVKAEMQGKGYGKMLMERVQSEWKDSGLWVRVFKRNERAVEFYRKWGFEIVAEQKVDMGEGQDEQAHTMRWSPVAT